MQLTAKSTASKLVPTNKAALKNTAGTAVGKSAYLPLLQLLAEGCDENAQGVNFYCTLGATKNGDAVTLSINLNGERQTLYGTNLLDLAMQVADLVGAL